MNLLRFVDPLHDMTVRETSWPGLHIFYMPYNGQRGFEDLENDVTVLLNDVKARVSSLFFCLRCTGNFKEDLGYCVQFTYNIIHVTIPCNVSCIKNVWHVSMYFILKRKSLDTSKHPHEQKNNVEGIFVCHSKRKIFWVNRFDFDWICFLLDGLQYLLLTCLNEG